MFDFGWSEIVVIGTIALVVIGPKDLPKALRTGGMLMRRVRSMAREFQNSVDDLIREAELDEIRKAVRVDLNKPIEDTTDPPVPQPPIQAPRADAAPTPPAPPQPVPEPVEAGTVPHEPAEDHTPEPSPETKHD